MPTMLLFCGEAGSGESLSWLHFNDGVPLLLEGDGAVLSCYGVAVAQVVEQVNG